MTNPSTKFLLTLALLTGPAVTLANSQTATPAQRSKQNDLFRYSFKLTYSPANRVELARRFEAYCREVLDAVPTNTPAEDAWVTTESTTSDVNRLTRLISSVEWARHQLKDTFSECLERVASLQQAQANSSRSAEAAQFVSLAYTFNQDADLAAFAKRADLKFPLSPYVNTFRQVLMIAAIRTLDGRDDK